MPASTLYAAGDDFERITRPDGSSDHQKHIGDAIVTGPALEFVVIHSAVGGQIGVEVKTSWLDIIFLNRQQA